VRLYQDRESLARDLDADLRPGDWVLVKGSRAMGLEAVADALCQGVATRDQGPGDREPGTGNATTTDNERRTTDP
jgi:hypothetical protein